MGKINFYHIPDNEKRVIFQEIGRLKNILPFAVE